MCYNRISLGKWGKQGKQGKQGKWEFSVFFFFLLCVFPVKAQQTASSMNLKGNVRILYTYSHVAKDITVKDNNQVSYNKVKLMKHIDYIFDKNGLLLAENRFNNEDIINISYIYDYNELGKLIEETTAEAGKFQLGREEYKYDKNGRKSHKTIYDDRDSLKHTIIYSYDSLGNLSAEKTYNKIIGITKEIHYKYDERGNLIFVNYPRMNIAKNKPSHEIQKFDNRNNLIYKSFTKDDTLIWEYTAHYNKKDSLIYEEVKDGNGKITSYSKLEFKKDKRTSLIQFNKASITETYYQYDKKGNLLIETQYTANKKDLIKIRTYLYDEKENWIYCIELNSNNGTSVVHSRKINYF